MGEKREAKNKIKGKKESRANGTNKNEKKDKHFWVWGKK